VLLFSATFSEKVKAFAMRTVPRANHIFVGEKDQSLDKIQQYQIHCPDVRSKIDVLKDRIFPAAEKLGQSIIFVRTRGSASELHKRLEADGYKCTSIQGGLTHEERDRVIKEFRAGVTKILIATDVLARGFDLAQVTMVVNFDLPVKHVADRHMPTTPDYETYLHRIGRSGRFGLKGAAFNLLVTEEDKRNLQRIEKHFNKTISEVAWDDDNGIERVLQEAGLA
jgi:ATP-dependent RNA helicase DDX19/DBP5